MIKKNMKFLSVTDMSRELDVPSYRIQYLFSKRKLKREDYPRVGRVLLFTESDIEKVKNLLAGINTFTWEETRKRASNQ